MEMQNINQQKWKVPKFHPGNIKKCEISNLNIASSLLSLLSNWGFTSNKWE